MRATWHDLLPTTSDSATNFAPATGSKDNSTWPPSWRATAPSPSASRHPQAGRSSPGPYRHRQPPHAHLQGQRARSRSLPQPHRRGQADGRHRGGQPPAPCRNGDALGLQGRPLAGASPGRLLQAVPVQLEQTVPNIHKNSSKHCNRVKIQLIIHKIRPN